MKELTYSQKVEQSINKRFRKGIWTKFVLALKRYNLVEDGDKIAVCISGGKDSMLLAKLMQMLKMISKTKFDLVFLCMDPDITKKIANKSKKMQKNLKFQSKFLKQIFLIAL